MDGVNVFVGVSVLVGVDVVVGLLVLVGVAVGAGAYSEVGGVKLLVHLAIPFENLISSKLQLQEFALESPPMLTFTVELFHKVIADVCVNTLLPPQKP